MPHNGSSDAKAGKLPMTSRFKQQAMNDGRYIFLPDSDNRNQQIIQAVSMSARRPREKLIVTFRYRDSKQHAIVIGSHKSIFYEIYLTA